MIMCPHTLLHPPYSSYLSHSLPFITSAHHHVPPQTSYGSGIGFFQPRDMIPAKTLFFYLNHPQIILHGSLNIEEPPPTTTHASYSQRHKGWVSGLSNSISGLDPFSFFLTQSRLNPLIHFSQYCGNSIHRLRHLSIPTSPGSGIEFYKTITPTRSFSFSFNHVQILYCYYSICLDRHLRRLYLPSSTPITATVKTTTHLFSFSLHQLYCHHFHCSHSFSLLLCFHVDKAAADFSFLRLLRSHCPTSVTDHIPRWLIRRHKLKPQNRSTGNQVYPRILSRTPPPGAAAVAVKNGCRILVGAVVEEVSAALVVTVLGPTLSSPPSLSITILYCSQQEKIDATGVLCLGSTDELAPAGLILMYIKGHHDYGPRIILIISMKKRDQMKVDVLCCGGTTEKLAQEGQHGPGMIVTSMKKRAVAYTDFLHPKAMGKLEVWSMYGFMICCCSQCSECELQNLSLMWIIHYKLLLSGQEVTGSNLVNSLSACKEFGGVSCASSSTCSHHKFFIDMALRRLSTWVIYPSVGDPKSGEKLEKMLISV